MHGLSTAPSRHRILGAERNTRSENYHDNLGIRYLHGLRLLCIVTFFTLLCQSFSFIPHFILFFYTPLLIHFPLLHSQLLQSLIRSVFHPTATNSLQTKQASSPIVSVPHACKDGPQNDKKGVCRPTDFHIRPSLSFPHAPPPLSCLLVVLYCMPYLN